MVKALKVAMELWINVTYVTSQKWYQPGYQQEIKILKQSNGGRVQFLHRTVFHTNHLIRLDFSTYRLQRDGPVLCLATSTRQKKLLVLHVDPLF